MNANERRAEITRRLELATGLLPHYPRTVPDTLTVHTGSAGAFQVTPGDLHASLGGIPVTVCGDASVTPASDASGVVVRAVRHWLQGVVSFDPATGLITTRGSALMRREQNGVGAWDRRKPVMKSAEAPLLQAWHDLVAQVPASFGHTCRDLASSRSHVENLALYGPKSDPAAALPASAPASEASLAWHAALHLAQYAYPAGTPDRAAAERSAHGYRSLMGHPAQDHVEVARAVLALACDTVAA